VAAAAACLLLAGLLRTVSGPREVSWPLQLARDVEIHNLEVHEGGMPFVFSAGDGSGVEVIWVLADDG
jgi:hypothetical protein